MTIMFDQDLISQAEKINSICYTEYTATDLHKALDCPVNFNGIAARIMADHENSIRFDISKNSFQLYAADKHGASEWRSVPLVVVRALIHRAVDDMGKELSLITNAKVAGIMPDDQDHAHTRKVLAFQEAFDTEGILAVLDVLRASLGAVRAAGRANFITQAAFDVLGG